MKDIKGGKPNINYLKFKIRDCVSGEAS